MAGNIVSEKLVGQGNVNKTQGIPLAAKKENGIKVRWICLQMIILRFSPSQSVQIKLWNHLWINYEKPF